MTKDLWSGDPALFSDENGLFIKFVNGQTLMDGGLRNLLLLLVGTDDWWGNSLTDDTEAHFKGGLHFSGEAITLSNLQNFQARAQKQVDKLVTWQIARKVRATVSNPQSNWLQLLIEVWPPDGTKEELLLYTNGQNWVNQIDNPINDSDGA
jgi:phage gp46-like protein